MVFIQNIVHIKLGFTYSVYVINPEEYKSVGSHWIAIYGNVDNVICFYGFGVDHIPKET